MFADEMDMLSIIKWRLTCKTNYYQAMKSLRRALTKMLDHFMPNPLAFLSILDTHRGVIGGEFALAFVLRDLAMLPDRLDMYASHNEFKALCASILGDARLNKTAIHQTYTQHTVLDALRTLVSTVLVIKMGCGPAIHVHRSYTVSSTAPITRASCTALCNFVTPHGFGCSHPMLTLNRRALLSDQDLSHLPTMNREVHDTLIKHNFSLELSPMSWPEFGHPVVTSILDTLPTPGQDGLDVKYSDESSTIALPAIPDTIALTTDASLIIATQRCPMQSTLRDAGLQNGDTHGVRHTPNAASTDTRSDLGTLTARMYVDGGSDQRAPGAVTSDILHDLATTHVPNDFSSATMETACDLDVVTCQAYRSRDVNWPIDHVVDTDNLLGPGALAARVQEDRDTVQGYPDCVAADNIRFGGPTMRTNETTNVLAHDESEGDIRTYAYVDAVVVHRRSNECERHHFL